MLPEREREGRIHSWVLAGQTWTETECVLCYVCFISNSFEYRERVT